MSLVNASVARGDGNEGATAVNHYKKWCVARGDRVLRPLDPLTSSLELKVNEAIRMAKFALFLVQVQGTSAKTASGYISVVNAWHRRRCFVGLAGDYPLSVSGSVLKGWARTHPPPRGVFHRIGITPQHLAAGMDAVLGKRGECSAQNQNMRACLTAAFAGLLRACEVALQDGKPVAFQVVPRRKDMATGKDGSRTILIREAKRSSLEGVAPAVSSPIQFYPGGKLIDVVAELDALVALDMLAAADAPLFRDTLSGKPLRVAVIRDAVKRIAAAAGLDPAFFGAHSLRFESSFTNSHLP